MRRYHDETIGTASRARVRRVVRLAIVAGVCLLAVGCKTSEPETKVVVPSAATQAPEYEGDGSIPEQRYVIRMSDGERDWEVQFPEVATGYEMQIPLDSQQKGSDSMTWSSENLTAADKQLLEELRRSRKGMEREGPYIDGKHVNDLQGADGSNSSGQQNEGSSTSGDDQSGQQKGNQPPGGPSPGSAESGGSAGQSGETGNGGDQTQKGSEAEAAPYRPSYLLGVEEVRRLYKAGKYELAMVKLKKLEKAYPDDVKLLSMEGTLWLKLGKENLARKAWDRVLQIDEDNEQVLEAKKRLNDSE